MTTSQQKLLPWLSNLVTKTIDQGLPVLPEVLFYLQKAIQKISFRQSESGQTESFSILNFVCSAVLCCNIYSFLFCCSLHCSALLCSSVLYSALLCSSLLCGFSGRVMPFSGREIAFSGREKTMGMGIGPVDTQQGWFCSVRWSSFIGSGRRHCGSHAR